MSDTPATVVDLAGNPVQPDGINNPNVIDLLRSILAAAERGEVISVAVVSVQPMAAIQTAWTYRHANDQYALHAGLDIARASILRAMMGTGYASSEGGPLGG
jgi:hypothetical protein